LSEQFVFAQTLSSIIEKTWEKILTCKIVLSTKDGASSLGVIFTLKLLKNGYNIQKSAVISWISITTQRGVGKMLFLYIFDTALSNVTLIFLLSLNLFFSTFSPKRYHGCAHHSYIRGQHSSKVHSICARLSFLFFPFLLFSLLYVFHLWGVIYLF